ncbi:AI-2E family transporter [uncultured Piscinibacter sp.]|uniref:AI-2E family transporter n=1 Tax=uncultured Piscinibacter sp. TaxID=1131835 RepID=UPI0026028388|nr:AI-2E family transporter [uncultured Piscinibacter sp.]
MNLTPQERPPAVETRAFVLLLVIVTLAFGVVLLPFWGAVFWGVIIAILSAPLRRLLVRRMRQRRTWAALATLAIVLLVVTPPLILIAASLVQEGSDVYARIKSGELNFGRYFREIVGALPPWFTQVLDWFGIGNLVDIEQRLTSAVTQASQLIATQVLGVGQNTLEFVVGFFVAMYLAFFLLRDGAALAPRVKAAIPLDETHKQALEQKFATVIRATVKGNIVIALIQGTLGGLALWVLDVRGALLWAVLMAFLSLLPAVGAGLIWAPVAVYLLVTGSVIQGAGLIVFGVLVIGMVDNVLRPILVGKDTRMPDYVVLISTLGGLAVFGINGFIIGPAIAAMFIAVWDIYVTERIEPPR